MEKLTSTKVADMVGINIETLRYYERIGIAPVPDRSQGGHRLYNADDIDRLKLIRRARAIGFSIEEIRSLLSVDASANRLSVRAIAKERLSRLLAELEEKRIAAELLSKAIEQCEANSCGCQILDMLKNADGFPSRDSDNHC